MSRILSVIGVISIVVVVLGIAAVAFAFYEGSKLDREATSYSSDSVVAITGRWDVEALRTRASPQLADAMGKAQGARIFTWLASLGPLQDRPECQGNATVYAGTGGNKTTANVTCTAHYRAGPATILLALAKKGGTWFILGFHVTSPELLPQQPIQKA